ncbi:MAG: hypothetical protein J0L64_25565 [Acidobacteria bacterium]|nr:hypothetical protein [Acidobacteriota bacterium]
MSVTRRGFLAASALAGCSRRPSEPGCASLAGKSIRWIVPFSAGGGYEMLSRLLEPHLEQSLGAEILIVNEPGNGGIVGASKLRDALPDGRTLGILNSAGLFAAAMTGSGGYPDPARDFSILGRLGRTQPVLFTAASSSIRSIEDLAAPKRSGGLLASVTGLGSNNFLTVSSVESILGLRFDYIAGYAGSRDEMLALLRGEVDLSSGNFESNQAGFEQGEIRPLLQVSDKPITEHPSFRNVPCLGGPNGWAARRAAALGQDVPAAEAAAAALISLYTPGILAAAPRLPSELAACLSDRFLDAASSPALAAAAKTTRRTLEIATGKQALQDLAAASRNITRFAPVVRAAFERVRR